MGQPEAWGLALSNAAHEKVDSVCAGSASPAAAAALS